MGYLDGTAGENRSGFAVLSGMTARIASASVHDPASSKASSVQNLGQCSHEVNRRDLPDLPRCRGAHRGQCRPPSLSPCGPVLAQMSGPVDVLRPLESASAFRAAVIRNVESCARLSPSWLLQDMA